MNRKLMARIVAGVLAGLMILGSITLTIMFLFSNMVAFGGLPM